MVGPHQEDELASRIEHYIAGKARGRIRELRVVCDGGRIILRGRSRTHHDKQVAQEAVFDVTGARTFLANEIIVGC
jgi:osmotically-inducible protein OsmY